MDTYTGAVKIGVNLTLAHGTDEPERQIEQEAKQGWGGLKIVSKNINSIIMVEIFL